MPIFCLLEGRFQAKLNRSFAPIFLDLLLIFTGLVLLFGIKSSLTC